MGKEYMEKAINTPCLAKESLKGRRDRGIYSFLKSKPVLNL